MKLKLILLLTITFTFIIILTSIEVVAAECVIEISPDKFIWDSTNPECRCTCTSDAQCIATLTVSAPGLGGYLTSTGNACTGKAMIDIDEQNRYFLTTCDDPSPILNAPYPDGGERLICPNEASSQYSPQVRQPICEPERALPGASPCVDALIINGLEISGCMINENSNYDSQYTEPKCKVCLECSGEVPLEECSDASCSKWDKRNCYYNPLVTIRPYNIDWDLSGEINPTLRGKYYCGYTDQFWDFINDGTLPTPNTPLFEVELSGDTEICDAVNDPDSCKNPCPDDTLNEFYVELDPKDIGIENLEKIREASLLDADSILKSLGSMTIRSLNDLGQFLIKSQFVGGTDMPVGLAKDFAMTNEFMAETFPTPVEQMQPYAYDYPYLTSATEIGYHGGNALLLIAGGLQGLAKKFPRFAGKLPTLGKKLNLPFGLGRKKDPFNYFIKKMGCSSKEDWIEAMNEQDALDVIREMLHKIGPERYKQMLMDYYGDKITSSIANQIVSDIFRTKPGYGLSIADINVEAATYFYGPINPAMPITPYSNVYFSIYPAEGLEFGGAFAGLKGGYPQSYLIDPATGIIIPGGIP